MMMMMMIMMVMMMMMVMVMMMMMVMVMMMMMMVMMMMMIISLFAANLGCGRPLQEREIYSHLHGMFLHSFPVIEETGHWLHNCFHKLYRHMLQVQTGTTVGSNILMQCMLADVDTGFIKLSEVNPMAGIRSKM
jgi:hypothetical protein